MVNRIGNSGWPKRITVERKIVNLLSRSLYADFPRAIRETVSNSYDADATVVNVRVDLLKREIVVEDNGVGMSVEQFDNYLRIAGTPIIQGFSERFGRKRIGRFGIGFLACFPFCDNLEITSKREGSDVGFTASIPTKRFVGETGIDEDISSIPIDGFNESFAGKRHEHFTRVKMSGLTDLVKDYFRARLEKKKISIESGTGMRRLRWELSETLPLDFKYKSSKLAQFLGNEPVGMEVFLNREKLFRSDPGGQILASSEMTKVQLGNLEFKYVITTDWKNIHPVEARGIKVRLNGVGIGARTYFDIEKEVRSFSRLHWISGEFHILEGLDESLAITRDSFVWSRDYQVLKDFFHTVLLRVHNKVEGVAEVERDISRLFSQGSAIANIGSADIINRSVRRLERVGFDIVYKKWDEVPNANFPIILDKERSRAVVIDDFSLGQVDEPETQVRYLPFSGEARLNVPVRVGDDGVIEINSSYPIFSGKTKGDILKRVHVLLLFAKNECRTAEDMYNYLIKRIRETFE